MELDRRRGRSGNRRSARSKRAESVRWRGCAACTGARARCCTPLRVCERVYLRAPWPSCVGGASGDRSELELVRRFNGARAVQGHCLGGHWKHVAMRLHRGTTHATAPELANGIGGGYRGMLGAMCTLALPHCLPRRFALPVARAAPFTGDCQPQPQQARTAARHRHRTRARAQRRECDAAPHVATLCSMLQRLAARCTPAHHAGELRGLGVGQSAIGFALRTCEAHAMRCGPVPVRAASRRAYSIHRFSL